MSEKKDTSSAGGLGRLLKQFFIYGLGSAIFPLVNIILLPIFTKGHYLTRDDFGILALYYVIASIAVFIITLAVPHTSMVRLFFDSSEEEVRFGYVGSSIFIMLTWGLGFSILLAMLAPFVGPLVFGKNTNYMLFWPLSIAGAYLGGWNTLLVNVVRITERPILFVITSSLNFIFVVGINILFVVVLGWGIDGAVGALAFANLLVIVSEFIIIVRRHMLIWNLKQVRELIAYALPILPANIGSWGMSLFDRFLIKAFVSLQDLGVYSIGARLGNVTNTLLVAPFRSVWPPYVYGLALEDKEKARDAVSRIYLYFLAVGLMFTLTLGVFAKEAILLLSTEEYLDARFVVPLLSFALLLNEMSSLIASGIHIAKKPGFITREYLKLVPLSIALNVLLLPRLGMYGAAVSAVISYGVLQLLYIYRVQKVFPIPIRTKGILLTLLYASVVYLSSVAIDSNFAFPISTFLKLLVYLAYPLLIFYGGVLRGDERKDAVVFFRNKVLSKLKSK